MNNFLQIKKPSTYLNGRRHSSANSLNTPITSGNNGINNFATKNKKKNEHQVFTFQTEEAKLGMKKN